MVFRATVASLASPNKGAFPHREVSSGGREPPTLSSCRRVCLPRIWAPKHNHCMNPNQAIQTLCHPHFCTRTCKGSPQSPAASPRAQPCGLSGEFSASGHPSGCWDLATPSCALGVTAQIPSPGTGQTIPCVLPPSYPGCQARPSLGDAE